VSVSSKSLSVNQTETYTKRRRNPSEMLKLFLNYLILLLLTGFGTLLASADVAAASEASESLNLRAPISAPKPEPKLLSTPNPTPTPKANIPFWGCSSPAGYSRNLKHRWLVDPTRSRRTFTDCGPLKANATVVRRQYVYFPVEKNGRTIRRIVEVREKPAGLTVPAWVGALRKKDFTITMWTKMGLDVPYEVRLQRWEMFSNRGGGDFGNWISIRARNWDNTVTFDMNDDKGFAQDALVGVVLPNSTIPALDFRWHHLAFVRRARKISIFVDGKLGANVTARRTANLGSSGLPVGIAYSPSYEDSFAFRGRIDDVRVYLEALGSWKLKQIIRAYLG